MDERPEKESRSAISIMVIVFTCLIAFYIVGSTIFVIVAEIHNPETDTSALAHTLESMITAILGALLGLIAGRSEMK